jgi:hypothetical protein
MGRQNRVKTREFVNACRQSLTSYRAKKSNTFFGIRINGLSPRLPCAQRPPLEVIASDYITFDSASGLVREALHETTQFAADII